MPIERELTDSELQELELKGIDSSQYKGKKVSITPPEELQQQTPPAPTSDSRISPLSTIARTEKANIGGQIGGGAGALGTGALLTGLGLAPFTEGVSLLPSILGMLGIGTAAAGGAYLGRKGQGAIVGEEKQRQLEQEAQEAAQQHPLISVAADITGSALASGGSFKPSNIPRAGRALLSTLVGKGAEAVDKNALQSVILNAGINPAINTGIGLAAGQGLPSGKDLLEQAAGGALFSGSSKLGRLAHMGGKEPIEVNTTVERVPESTIQPDALSPFTIKDQGKHVIDDTAVKQGFKEQNPQPDTTGMSDVDSYKAMTAWRNKMKLSAEDMRRQMHESFLKKQLEIPQTQPTVNIPKPEPTPEVVAKSVEQPKVSWQDQAKNLWDSITDSTAREKYVGNRTDLKGQLWEQLTPLEKEAMAKNLGVKIPSVAQPNLTNPDITTQMAKERVLSDAAPKGLQTLAMEQAAPEANKQLAALLDKPVGGTEELPQVEKPLGSKIVQAPPSDYDRHTQIQQEMRDLMKAGKMNEPEFFTKFKEFEDLRNRHSGMPPAKDNSTLGQPKGGVMTVADHLSKIGADKNSPHSELAKSLVLDKDALKVPVVVSKEMTTDKGLRSHYQSGDDKIYLEPGDEKNHSYVMHEILHAATEKNLSPEFEGLRGYRLKGAMDEYIKSGSNEHVKEIIRSYIDTVKQLGLHSELFGETVKGKPMLSRGLAGAPDETVNKVPHGYALGNVSEFIASVANDTNFRQHLNEMPSGVEGKSMLSRITDAIRKLLGVPVKEGSMLERVLKPIDELASMDRPVEKMVERSSIKVQAPPKEEIPHARVGGFIGRGFRALTDKIRDINHPAAKLVGDAMHNMLQESQNLQGKLLNPILEKAKNYNLIGNKASDDRLKAAAYFKMENKQEPPSSMFKSRAEQDVFNEFYKSYKEDFNERFKNEQPVTRGGQQTMPRSDPNKYPTITSPEVSKDYHSGNKDKIEMRDKQFLNYQDKIGFTKDEALSNLKDWKQTIMGKASEDNGGMGNRQFFNAHRIEQGTQLPPEFTRGFFKNIEAYFHRSTPDIAYYKHIESNPKVMAALGETKDAWNRPIEPDVNGSIARVQPVKDAINAVRGTISGSDDVERSLASAATTAIMGPGTTIHKFLTNQLGVTNLADNPYQLTKILTSMVTDYSSGLKHSVENGVIKYNAKSGYDLLAGNITFAERLQALSHLVKGVYSLGDLTDKWGTGLMQAGIEGVIPMKLAKANEGDLTNMQWFRKLDPSYEKGRIYTDNEISKLASNAVGYIHGTGDARTLPGWMLKDTEISGFFKLSHWGISQTNRFMSDIYTPAMQGDYKPLLTSLFGAAVGGYVIKELREKVQGKQGQIPSLDEIASSKDEVTGERGLKGNPGLLAYNLMASLSYAGFGGMLSQFAKIPFDKVYRNSSAGLVFPLDEVTSDLGHVTGQIIDVIANDPKVNWLDLTKELTHHFITTNFQLGRVAFNQAVDKGLITGLPADKKKLADKLGQLRRFDLTEGLPVNEVDTTGNPFLNIEQKKFKMEQNPDEIAKQLPALVSNIIEKYGNNPDVMLSKLHGLKQNSYATFPSMESTPLSFMKYISYLNKLEGPEKAQTALVDYLIHKSVNEAKASVIP